MIFFKGVGWQIAIELDSDKSASSWAKTIQIGISEKTFLGLSIFHTSRRISTWIGPLMTPNEGLLIYEV